MHQMRKDEIPDFVREILATGCDMRAVGEKHYVIGDADLPEKAYVDAQAELVRVWSRYGTHDHLKLEIIAHLHSIGRSFPPPLLH